MSDYSSWKVADLKAECKKRGIPQTGLRLKQQFIDKLNEVDSQTNQDETEAAAPAKETTEPEPSAPDAVAEAPVPQPEVSQNGEPEPTDGQSTTQTEETLVAASGSDRAQDGEEQTDEPTQGETDTTADTKLSQAENATETAEPTQAKEDVPDHQESPAALSQHQVDGPAQDVKDEEHVKPEENLTTSAPQTSGFNTELSTPLPVEETLEDTRKRKRRSQSPAPTQEEIENRKARAKEAAPQELLKEERPTSVDPEAQKAAEAQTDNKPAETSRDTHKTSTKQDARFRDLFAPAAAPQRASPPRDVTMQDAEVTPALHAATATLYIDGLMRPLQPTALRNHLASLASAPGTEEPEPIVDFYLDSIKTHCFVSFSSLTAASRVRSAIHGAVWPNERNRKNLRADFIPDEKIKEWIQVEEESRDRAGPAVRWEVKYETGDDDEVTATLAEVGSAPSGRRESGFNRTPPLGPRRDMEQLARRPSNAAPAPPARPGQGFKPLDELFESTTAKPKLYYLPVPRAVADKRLDQFDELIRKGTFPRRGGDEMRRITFEDEDQFVDIGPERFNPGPRSGPRSGGRGRGRGGHGRGDSWRS
ncbi:DNA-binding SAP [Penicillium bovifimosum]|uniref:DNA-binding SAP n=1 Tax=Penicillium bovifimosum TaxID=126998 RepID=A0A9W9HGA8_9EURO|nr:DNA-binding SAP [Penicillium bovifimosum]KAJ5146253.1 DNA-binding SAP [Penicillium bovifimosum]